MNVSRSYAPEGRSVARQRRDAGLPDIAVHGSLVWATAAQTFADRFLDGDPVLDVCDGDEPVLSGIVETESSDRATL